MKKTLIDNQNGKDDKINEVVNDKKICQLNGLSVENGSKDE